MKQFRFSPRLWPYFLFALIFLAAGSARANCSNPTDTEGKIIYNGDFHTYQFCDGTNWDSMKGGGGGGGGSGGLTLISTQTASASASLQFTNLPTSYNTLFLNCTGLLQSVSGGGEQIQLILGEGAGPTWETGAHYSIAQWWLAGAGSGSVAIANGTGLLITSGGSTTIPLGFQAYIGNISSTTLYKMVFINLVGYKDVGSAFASTTGSGYWNNDTNPITGIEVIPSGGNIASGTCSLYGMQ